MKRKNFVYLAILLITLFSGVFSCKEADEEKATSLPPDLPLFSEGQIVTSEISKDDVVIEAMIDTVVNLGSAEAPALFYVNQSHTLEGLELENGNTPSLAFRSLTRQDHMLFIVLWARLFGVVVDLNDHSQEAVSLRQRAFYKLSQFLIKNEVDFPLLVALGQNSLELESAVKLVEASAATLKSGDAASQANDINSIFRELEINGIKPSALCSAIESEGMSPQQFLAMADQKGIDLPTLLKQGGSPRGVVTAVIKAVCKAVVYISKFIVWFIENGKAVVDLEDSYTSYLHQDDPDPMDYISQKPYQTSPTYSVKYCSLATASFYIETYYSAIHQTLPGHYVNRSGMIVKSVTCSGGMHVKGKTEWGAPVTIGTNEDPIASSSNTVTVNYGDCCCFARTAILTFDLSGDQGYKETSWDSNVK
jgi:hypothetical protein